jgi:RimJ/RimL family protein N-acetyltransferase
MMNLSSLAKALEGLETPRLTIRPALPVDGWELFDATRHNDFNRFLSWSAPSEPYEVVARMEAVVQAHMRGDICALSALHRESGRWIGLFRFLRYRPDPRIVEISLWIHSDFHHDSLGWEITRSLVDRAFHATKMPLMLAASCQDNRPAQRLLLSCGFTYDGVVPRPHEEGHPLHLFEYRQTYEQWEAALEGRDPTVLPLLRPRSRAVAEPTAANESQLRAVSGS